jgi:hypothetical protein
MSSSTLIRSTATSLFLTLWQSSFEQPPRASFSTHQPHLGWDYSLGLREQGEWTDRRAHAPCVSSDICDIIHWPISRAWGPCELSATTSVYRDAHHSANKGSRAGGSKSPSRSRRDQVTSVEVLQIGARSDVAIDVFDTTPCRTGLIDAVSLLSHVMRPSRSFCLSMPDTLPLIIEF